MFQDIFPFVFSNEFAVKTPKEGDLIFLFQEGQPLFYLQKGQMMVPTYEIIKEHLPQTLLSTIYLCRVDDTCGFLIGVNEQPPVALNDLEQFTVGVLHNFRSLTPTWHGFMGVTAHHLYQWYRYNQFCGGCGGKMSPSPKERHMVCPSCGFTDYPKICPAVIVAVKHGDRILLTKYANRAFARYALIAGFCEIGETVEQTIHREVMEEVGIKVKNLTYYKSQPWGFSQSLLFGFFADLDGDEHITLDHEELGVGQWVKREDIPMDTENSLSLTYTMMQAFKNGEF